MFKKISLFMVLIMLVFSFAGCGGKEVANEENKENEEIYNKALEYIASGDYYSALDIIIELEDYKDCKDLKENFVFVCTKEGEGTVREYDKNGNCTKYTNANSVVTYYEYDENDLCVKETSVWDEGYYGYVTYYEYDENDNPIKSRTVDYDGNEGEGYMEYDENGNQIKEYRTDTDGREYSTVREFDENGNCIKEVAKGYDGGDILTLYEYDDKGNMTRYEQNWGSYMEVNIENTYNSKGLLVKVTQSVLEGETEEARVFEISYEYDAYGNKTKETWVNDGYTSETNYEYELLYVTK